MATIARTLNLRGVLSESKRIINAHSRHFLALSVLFLLPLSFSLIIYPTLQNTLSQSPSYHHSQALLRHTPSPTYSFKTISLLLLYALFYLIVSLSASATITYSTYHGFYGRPVKLAAAVKSLVSSFIPLIVTSIVTHLIVALVCATVALFPFFVTKLAGILGFEIDYDLSNYYFVGLCAVVFVFLLFVLVRLKVNWALVPVIVVVESKWGLEPLRRSTYLMKGMRAVSLSLFLLFGTVSLLFLWVFGSEQPTSTNYYDFSDGWSCLSFVSQTVVGSSFVTMLMLYSVASNTVLYMYCKALHGELALEIAEEFAREYVSLPFDDAKVPHVVFVTQA